MKKWDNASPKNENLNLMSFQTCMTFFFGTKIIEF